MLLTSIKTDVFTPGESSMKDLLREIPKLDNGSIIAISSKVLSICEGAFIHSEDADYIKLVESKSKATLGTENNSEEYSILTRVDDFFVESAGVDKANTNNYFVFYPKNPYKSAEYLWRKLRVRDHIKKLGVIIVDSHAVPFRKGSIGFSIAFYGFMPVNRYKSKDVFDNSFKHTMSNIVDGLAAAAVAVMGEGAEKTPLCTIENAQNVKFFETEKELSDVKELLRVEQDSDVYQLLIDSAEWNKR